MVQSLQPIYYRLVKQFNTLLYIHGDLPPINFVLHILNFVVVFFHFIYVVFIPNRYALFLHAECASMRSYSDYSNSFDEHIIDPSSNQIGIICFVLLLEFPFNSCRRQFQDCIFSCLDSAHALFVRATYLVCHRLISTWKADLPVSLAALELLNGLARIKVQDQGNCIELVHLFGKSKIYLYGPFHHFADPLECRRAVKWVCDFIIHQCSRPPKDHSKDLHSSIVAAFQCVTTWLTAHPYLLEDKESLFTVLEVVEFGISGTKSQVI